MMLVLHSMFFYLSLFHVSDDLGTNPFKERWNDAIQAILRDPLEVPIGLVTRLIRTYPKAQ